MAEDDPAPDRLDQLIERVNFMEQTLRSQLARLYAIERNLGIAQAPPVQEQPRPPQPERREPARPPSIRPPVSQPPPREQQTGPSKTSGPPPKQPWEPLSGPAANRPEPRPRGDLEARIGGNWLNRIGIIAITFGVAFFLKYAFENEWIGPAGRVGIGVVLGLGFLAGGELLRKRYASYAYGLTGGGILILYLAIYAAFSFYSLIPHLLAFVFMAAVTMIASLLSARYSALPIAVLGLIGGFLTPILLSTGRDNQTGLFTYIALLDAGVLALAYSKQWRVLNYMSFGATVLMFAGWMVTFYDDSKLWPTIFFLTLLFGIFALLAMTHNVFNRRPTTWADLALVFLNGLLYFGTSYALLEETHRSYLGLFAVAVSAFYLGLGLFTYRRDREDRLLVYTFLGLAFLFLVLAVPIQTDQHWVTMGWAIQGAVMTWIGLRVDDRTSRYAALLLFMIAVSHWIVIDVNDFAYRANETFTPLLNRRALSCGVLILALAACVWFYRRSGERLDDEERSALLGIYTLGANALAVALLSIDANDYFEQRKALAAAGASADGYDWWGRIENTHRFTLTVLWTIYGATALVVSLARKLKPLRLAAFLLLIVTTAKLLLRDLAYYDAAWHTTFFNQTFAAFILLIAALAYGAWRYARAEGIEESERFVAVAVLVATANLLAIIALSAEAIGHFERAQAAVGGGTGALDEVSRLENIKQLALSAVWIVYGATALIIGIRRDHRATRLVSLGLLAVAAVKLLVLDLRYYDAAWHTVILNQTFGAFALLIAAMVVAAWFYLRAADVDEGERSIAVMALIAAANLLLLVALSAEATGYYARQIREGGEEVRDLRLARQLSLSVIWAVYGGAMLAVGMVRRQRLLRIMGLLLLGVTIFKVFIVDLASLDQVYRMISFIVLGLILLTVSFLYQRLRLLIIDDGESGDGSQKPEARIQKSGARNRND